MSAEQQIEALAFLIEKKIVRYEPKTETFHLVRSPSAEALKSLARELASREPSN